MLIVTMMATMMSCGGQSEVDTYEEYLKWLNDEENGLVKNKQAGGITLKVKQLPSDYLVYQDLSQEKSITKTMVDSIKKRYDQSLTFLMTIGVEEGKKGGDIMYRGIKNYKEYKERLMTMSFDIENYITLKMNGNTYRPVLSNLENVYGLTESRNIMLVFVPETKEDNIFYTAQEMQFTFDDELFDTGINHFKFKREDINQTPSYNYWN